MMKKTATRIEFGDFQTPPELAVAATRIVAAGSPSPASIVEPTCGTGNFLFAALDCFASVKQALGLEINPSYFREVDARLARRRPQQTVDLRRMDFFSFDWPLALAALPEPIMVIGNPPWVTASELGYLRGSNLPTKSNFQNRSGLDAKTGKSNFDIAEWMLIHLLRWLAGRKAVLAVLVKTTVARKVLHHAWKTDMPLTDAAMYLIDAKKHFGVDVAACLLVCRVGDGPRVRQCKVSHIDSPTITDHFIGYRDGMILADLQAFERHEHLRQSHGIVPFYRWRSGIKHDCADVMELRISDAGLVNGRGEKADLEADFLYPMLKGSAVANGSACMGNRYMIVPQRETGEPTHFIKQRAPKTWAYLCKHGDRLDRRGSSIYRNRPRFSIFGVGPYTFKPWKVAICGLYKRLDFMVVGPCGGKAVVFDDTIYHLSIESEQEARLVAHVLNSPHAKAFFEAFIFWDAKRPITVELLHRLDVLALAEMLGCRDQLLQEHRLDHCPAPEQDAVGKLLFS